MAKITEDLKYSTTWDLGRDINDLTGRIEWAAKGMLQRRYIFLGETHTLGFDKERNFAIAEKFMDDPRVIVVVERGMFATNRNFVNSGKSVILETTTMEEASSSAHKRNVLIVEKLVAEMKNDKPYTNPRPVIIIFGQEHENAIREELKKQLPDSINICWWSYQSIDDQYESLPARHQPAKGSFTLLGVTYRSLGGTSLELQLLTKGLVPAPFKLTVHGTFNPPMDSKDLTAIYVKNGTAENHAAEIELKGKTTLVVFDINKFLGLNCVRSGLDSLPEVL